MSGSTRVSRYQKGKTKKVKTNLDLLEQETMRKGSGICWAICKSAPHADNHANIPPLCFFYRPDALPDAQPTASKHASYQNIMNKKALREHKPPPNMAIRRIRISDFGLTDPKRDPDRHQNCITWSLSHALPLQTISSKSVHEFASNPTDRQTNRQTDRTKNITSFFGGISIEINLEN